MLLCARPFSVLVLILAFVPTNVIAQTIPFADLSDHIKPNDAVSVTDIDGSRFEGRVAEFTPTSLTLLIYGTSRRTFPATTVRSIGVGDSLWNGARTGLIAGIVPGVLLATFLQGFEEDPDGGSCAPGAKGPCPNYYLSVVPGFAALGLAIGVGIDQARRRTIDVLASPRGARLTIAPTISTARQAMIVSIRF